SIGHEEQTRVLEHMKALKAIKADSFAQTYAPLFTTLVDNYSYYTSGSASAISKVASAFDSVINPFGVVDKSQVTLSDVTGEGPFDEAVQFCFSNSLMAAQSDSEFGVNLPATLGEFAQILVMAIGGSYGPEESIEFFAGYGVVPMAEPGTELTVGELDAISCKFLAVAAGVNLDQLMVSDLEAMGIDPASKATRDIMAQYVYAMLN
ncbi:MAG: hypothetical protein ILP16_02205, partial [Spirochaetales bacterium]|nr:hypothetical protein [Spirochaetales bacterium]